MDHLQELLATDDRQALEFFFLGLMNVSETTVDQQELLYNASVLAHYAQVSTRTEFDLPTPSSLSEVFDQFVCDSSLVLQSDLMESAGAQCLLLAGFFERQMSQRHNIGWYARLGAGFFSRAAAQERSLNKARLLDTMARHFEPWRRRYSRLSRDLMKQPYLLPPPSPPKRL